MQLVVWSPQEGDPEMPLPVSGAFPAGTRQADVPADETVPPGAPVFSLLLEADTAAGALQSMQRFGESADDGGLFWRNAAAELAAELQSFTVQVRSGAEADEIA